MKASKQPNIVVIMADQWAADAVAALGHSAVITPHIDAVVASGATFSNAYCNSPICAPSRAAFTTGTLVRRNRVYDNGSELAASTPTFMHSLRQHGYETVLSGKMHFLGPDQLHGFERRLTTDIYPAGFDWTPDWSRGTYPNQGTSVRRLQEAGVCTWNTQLAYDEETLFRGLERIRQHERSATERALFLCVSFTHPHCPFEITEEYWERYADVKIPQPAVPDGSIAEQHPFEQWIATHHETDRITLSAPQVERARRAYYGMVSYIDDAVGQIDAELQRCGLADDTLFVITSDHGEMLGEHGMWFKRTFYDPSSKVPLIVRWPGRIAAGKRIDEVVSLVDLAATFVDVATSTEAHEDAALGERSQWTTDGESLVSLLVATDPDWKDEAIIEYFSEGTLHPLVAIRRGRFKYVHVHTCEPLLFDLVDDPHELDNIAARPENAELVASLRQAALGDLDLAVLEADILRSQQERLFVRFAQEKGEHPSWDYQPVFDASRQYVRRRRNHGRTVP